MFMGSIAHLKGLVMSVHGFVDSLGNVVSCEAEAENAFKGPV